MFSLQSVPAPLSGGVPPDAFDPATAAPLAKQLAETAAYPTPGSAADNAMAEQVKQQFSAIDGASVSEQRFSGSFHGHDVDLRNLIATLPGESNRQIALIAPRDVARGSGAVTSAAATAAMLQIADSFSGSSHHKTLVFVSTDGSSIGAQGAKRFVRDYSDTGLLDAAIVLSQPAVQHPTAPLVIPWSTGPQSTASQIDETANSIVSKEAATPAGDEGPLADLFRLALPAGLGEQGPLVEAGLPAVRLSSDGELPLDPGQDTPDNFNTDTFARFGRASLALILALDASPGAVQHGPSGYIGLAGNLLPGWTIAMLALALLFPVALAAGSGLASAARSPIEAARGFLWAGLRTVPFLGALLILLAATLVGLMPSPDFPFDPRHRVARDWEARSRWSWRSSPTARSRSSCGPCGHLPLARPRAQLRPPCCSRARQRSASGSSIHISGCSSHSACRRGSSPRRGLAALPRPGCSCWACCRWRRWSRTSPGASMRAWGSGTTCC